MVKKTAANSELLKDTKKKYNKLIYKKILNTYNDKGFEAAKQKMEEIHTNLFFGKYIGNYKN